VFAITTFDKIRIDDPVGAISVHGVVGIWGLLAVPISNGDAGIGGQLLGAVSIVAWVGITSALAWFVLDKVLGLRVSAEDEYQGVDVSECGLDAYPEFTGARAILND
jgi:Amt family ammonium transporter